MHVQSVAALQAGAYSCSLADRASDVLRNPELLKQVLAMVRQVAPEKKMATDQLAWPGLDQAVQDSLMAAQGLGLHSYPSKVWRLPWVTRLCPALLMLADDPVKQSFA